MNRKSEAQLLRNPERCFDTAVAQTTEMGSNLATASNNSDNSVMQT
jgi:hypothetical protein